MPVGEQAGLRVTWNHFLFPPRRRSATRFRRRGVFPLFRSRCSFGASLMPPGETLAARPEAGEIAAARRTTVGCRANSQQEPSPAWRTVVLLAPGGQLLSVAAGAACIFPCAIGPHAGFPTVAATAAPQLRDSQPAAEKLRKVLALGDPHIARSAFWASELHPNLFGQLSHRRGNTPGDY